MVNMNENVYLRRGEAERAHIPAMPFWFAILRVVQFVLAFVVMALCAYGASVFGAALFNGYAMSFFTFAWTLIFFAYIFVTPLWFPTAYIYWAHLALEILSFIFWLTTFALLVEADAAWNAVGDLDNFVDGVLVDEGLGVDIWPQGASAAKASKAASGLAAINWLLFGVSLAFFSLSVHKHRIATGETGFSGTATRAPPTGDLEAAEKPVELTNVQEHPVPSPYPA